MGLIESLKAKAIQATDVLNKLNDPFSAFDRPPCPKEKKKLFELESEFYTDLTTNFWRCNNQILISRIPQDTRLSLDMGDQAIWHGIYTGILALRYSLTPDDEQQKVLLQLMQAVRGLVLHQTIHAEKYPRLIRGVSNDLTSWQDDASNDTATGHLFGIYFAWKFGPPSLYPVLISLAHGLAAELYDHSNNLVGPSGIPTTYGTLDQGWKTDPLRITLALAIYGVASVMTQEPEFLTAYSTLYKKYKDLVPYPKVKLWWIDNANDTHRAALHLMILSSLNEGSIREQCRSGLERIIEMARKDGNAWVIALCATGGVAIDARDREIIRTVLSEFSLTDKMYNPGRDKYAEPPSLPWFKPILWNGTWMANQPLPRWMVRSQDFFWQRNLRSLDVGSSGALGDSRFNGGDYLAAYWMSRLAGIIGNAE